MAEALVEAADNLESLGFRSRCAQIFVSGPQNFREILTANDKNRCRQVIRDRGLRTVIHGAYVDHPWNRAPGAVHNIKQELRVASEIGATGVIVHLGAGAASDDNLKYVLEEVSDLPDDVLPADSELTLWLEIHAAKPSQFTYETPEKISDLFARVARCDTKRLKIGLCIDTAHLFSCGVSLDTYEKADAWLRRLPAVPIMMHLNDSAAALASGRDEHAMLTRGHIWDAYNIETGVLPIEDSGLTAILNWAELGEISIILERDPVGAASDLLLIRRLGYFRD